MPYVQDPETVAVTVILVGTMSLATKLAAGVAPGNIRSVVVPTPVKAVLVRILYEKLEAVLPFMATVTLPAPAVIFTTKTSLLALYVDNAMAV